MDGRTVFEDVISNSDKEVKNFILTELSKFLVGNEYREAIYGFIGYEDSQIKVLKGVTYFLSRTLCVLGHVRMRVWAI